MVDLVRTKSPPVHGTPPARLLHAESALRRPRRWKEQSDPARLAEIVTWERNALLHRHHLPFGVAALDAPTTIPTAEWLTFLQTARRAPPGAADGFTDSDFDWLGLDFWVERSKNTVDNDELNLVRGNRTWPRVWLTSESRSRPASSGLGTCRIARYEPQHVEVEVTLKSPAMLVLSDAFDPNWVVSTRDLGSNTERLLTIKKVAGLVRGVELPAGEQRVVFKNRPRPFFWGAAITLVSLIAVGIAFWPPLTRTPAARD